MRPLPLRSTLIAGLLLGPLADPLPAQVVVRPSPPAPVRPTGISPYLNLVRPGNPAINYYGLVRPEVEFRNAYQNLQSQLNVIQAEAPADAAGNVVLPTTGYPVRFMDYTRYYFRLPGVTTSPTFRQPATGGIIGPLPGVLPTVPPPRRIY